MVKNNEHRYCNILQTINEYVTINLKTYTMISQRILVSLPYLLLSLKNLYSHGTDDMALHIMITIMDMKSTSYIQGKIKNRRRKKLSFSIYVLYYYLGIIETVKRNGLRFSGWKKKLQFLIFCCARPSAQAHELRNLSTAQDPIFNIVEE